MTAGQRLVTAQEVDLLARITSMGKLHHAMTGTGGVAIAVAASIEGSVLAEVMPPGQRDEVRFGHASGVQSVGATLSKDDGDALSVVKATLRRTARRLMIGSVLVPSAFI
jgi:2-methylaconitate cis-trans-isomerase PrpF